jgi:trimethylamine--corrinoid protein Co-methyltransferase
MLDTDRHNLGFPFFLQLTAEDVQRIDEASLEILNRTGIRFFEEEALALFRKGGSIVQDGNLVRIPHHLVEWALRTAPKNITLYNQRGERALEVGGRRSYYGVGSDCRHIYDLETRQRREALLDDVVAGIRLVEHLPNMDFVMSMFMPTDVPLGTHEPRQMAIMLRESTKPIVFVGESLESTIYSIEMAEAVAGGGEHLERYPFVVNYVNATSSFRHNRASVQRLMYAAERNLPSIYSPANSRGTTAPITPAGALALGNAGQLAGLVLTQIKREGAPFIRSSPGGNSIDMRTMVSLYGEPDEGPAGWDLARHHRLPTFGKGGCSDAKIFDAQAAAEATLTLFAETINGANLIHDIGYLDCAMTGSLAFVAFCDEIVGWLKRYLRPAEINEETLALDVIHEVGPDEYFLSTSHTLEHVRDDWAPSLFDRSNFTRWSEQGELTLQARAEEVVRRLLKTAKTEPLPPDVDHKLEAILNRVVEP